MKIEEYKQLSEAILTLDAATTRQKAHEALSTLKVAQLKAVADHYKVFSMKKTKKALIEKIIDSTIGRKLTSEAIASINLK